MTISYDRLIELLSYDPDTGVFVWNVGMRGHPELAGCIAGTRNPVSGYLTIVIDARRYYCHRLAWLYVHGIWPSAEIDHANGNRLDNRLANLREATRVQQLANSKVKSTSKSGIKGVRLCHGSNTRWEARIRINGRRKHLGCFASAMEAAAAYDAAALAAHRERSYQARVAQAIAANRSGFTTVLAA